MKILVLSLLRIGDVIQQRPLLQELRRQNPGVRIDLLVNRSSMPVIEVVQEADNWIFFERDEFQQKVGIAEIPILAPVHELALFIARLSEEKYDLILNFTHNRLSAYLAEAISAREKRGLVAEGPQFRAFENDWIRHLNQRAQSAEGTPFQFAELLAGAFGLHVQPTEAKSKGKMVLLQPLTSDAKKNWSLVHWAALLENLRTRFSDYDFKVLGAPSDGALLARHFSFEDLALEGFAEVQGMMAKSALLITGDTSIKHIAVATGVPVLEIALGSSNPQRTGAYATNAFILQARVACAPCAHSDRCRKISHECGEALSLQDVENVAVSLLTGQQPESVQAPVQLWRTQSTIGEWTIGSSRAEHFEAALNRKMWRYFLDGLSFESNLQGLTDSSIDGELLRLALKNFSNDCEELEGIARKIVGQLDQVAKQCLEDGFAVQSLSPFRQSLSSLQFSRSSQIAQMFDLVELGQRPFAHPLAFFGAVQKSLADLGIRLRLAKQMIEIISAQGGIYERTSGVPSDRGPEAP